MKAFLASMPAGYVTSGSYNDVLVAITKATGRKLESIGMNLHILFSLSTSIPLVCLALVVTGWVAGLVVQAGRQASPAAGVDTRWVGRPG